MLTLCKDFGTSRNYKHFFLSLRRIFAFPLLLIIGDRVEIFSRTEESRTFLGSFHLNSVNRICINVCFLFLPLWVFRVFYKVCRSVWLLVTIFLFGFVLAVELSEGYVASLDRVLNLTCRRENFEHFGNGKLV